MSFSPADERQVREGGGRKRRGKQKALHSVPHCGRAPSHHFGQFSVGNTISKTGVCSHTEMTKCSRGEVMQLTCLHGAGPMQMAVPLQVGSFCYSPARSSWMHAGHSWGVSRCPPAGEEAPGSRNPRGLTTNRGQRRRDAVRITSKVPRAFPKAPHSRRSSETIEAEQ